MLDRIISHAINLAKLPIFKLVLGIIMT